MRGRRRKISYPAAARPLGVVVNDARLLDMIENRGARTGKPGTDGTFQQ
jgi:hypothetical protein